MASNQKPQNVSGVIHWCDCQARYACPFAEGGLRGRDCADFPAAALKESSLPVERAKPPPDLVHHRQDRHEQREGGGILPSVHARKKLSKFDLDVPMDNIAAPATPVEKVYINVQCGGCKREPCEETPTLRVYIFLGKSPSVIALA